MCESRVAPLALNNLVPFFPSAAAGALARRQP
jgi:hypothetical protein